MQAGLCMKILAGFSIYLDISFFRITSIVFSLTSEVGLRIDNRLMAQFPEVTVQVLLVIVAEAINVCGLVSYGIDTCSG